MEITGIILIKGFWRKEPMGFKNYIYMAYINLLRRKKVVITNVGLFSLALIIFMATSACTKGLDIFINQFILNTVQHRTLMISAMRYDDFSKIYDRFADDERIIDIYDLEQSSGFEIINKEEVFGEKTEEEYYVYLEPYNKAIAPYLLAGDLIEDTQHVALMPKFYYPKLHSTTHYMKEEIEFLDGEDFIGKTLVIEFPIYDANGKEEMVVIDTYTYDFKVIGVYDNIANLNDACDIYVPVQDLNYINQKMEEESVGFAQIYNHNLAVVVDDFKNVNDIINELLAIGYEGKLKARIGPIKEIMISITVIGFIISLVTLIFAVLNISISTLNHIKKRKNEIGLLKAIGYLNKNITTMVLVETLMIGMISVFSSYVISYSLTLLANLFIKHNMTMYMSRLSIRLQPQTIIAVLIVGVIVPILSSMLGIHYVLGLQPTEALKTTE